MSGIDIQAKVKSGLAKATAAIGSGDKVYIQRKTETAGTPLNPGTVSTESIELVDAIFKSISLTQADNTLVQLGDRYLISNSDVEIKLNDIITQGSRQMIVVSPSVVEPSGVVLVYKSIIRDM